MVIIMCECGLRYRNGALGIAVKRGGKVAVCWEQLRWSISFQSVGLPESPATKKAAASQAWQPRRRPEEQVASNWRNIG